MTRPVWQVELLRKTFFVPVGTGIPSGLWKATIGTDPEDETLKPLLKTSTESGQWNGYTLTITSQPGRVDLILSQTPNVPSLPNIGKYQDVVSEFNKLGVPEGLTPIVRVAFGAVMLAPYNSHKDCYVGLGEILTHVKLSTNSREFLYRINNPVISCTHANLSLNCISTWGAIKAVMVSLSDSKTSENTLYAVRTELDISSEAESELPNTVNIATLLEEFCNHGLRVLEEGPAP